MEEYKYSSIRKIHSGLSGEVNIDSNGETVASTGFHISSDGTIEIGPSGGTVFVRPENLRKGLGKKVCQEALKIAKEQAIENGDQLKKSIITTADWNIAAQRLAKSLGYKLTSEDYIDNTHTYELTF